MEQKSNNIPPGYEAVPGALRPIDTPAGYLARGDGLTLYCASKEPCPRKSSGGVAVDFGALVAKGLGDVTIDELRARWRCGHCGAPPQIILSSGRVPGMGGYPKW